MCALFVAVVFRRARRQPPHRLRLRRRHGVLARDGLPTEEQAHRAGADPAPGPSSVLFVKPRNVGFLSSHSPLPQRPWLSSIVAVYRSVHDDAVQVISGKLVKKTMAESINFRGVTENISFSGGRAGSKVRPSPSQFARWPCALHRPHFALPCRPPSSLPYYPTCFFFECHSPDPFYVMLTCLPACFSGLRLWGP